MKLYFRLLCLWWHLKKANTIALDDTSVLLSRVWPTDLDFNGHMTNTRYASLFDLSHIQIFSQLKLIEELKKESWSPVINARTISYFKELSPFESFKVTAKLIFWDRSYFYLEQRIINRSGKTCAIGYSRGLILNKKKTKKKGIIPLQNVIERAAKQKENFKDVVHNQLTSPEMPEHIQHWKDTLQVQKLTAKKYSKTIKD